ncbi:hypothetical protein EYF80_047835 [Liparis tanakae]|uniref:Uncharacterized protein n=1 Tax=Liparis tanakae TaxID=230148 RepID=A0A4Z2FLV1_9TELE|nr:hypothetical protein EYF80_047835 [Liparis tanakae]
MLPLISIGEAQHAPILDRDTIYSPVLTTERNVTFQSSAWIVSHTMNGRAEEVEDGVNKTP